MSNNDSPKPSEASTQAAKPDTSPASATKRWPKRLLEYAVFILLFIALSSWLNRQLLDDGSQIPAINLPTLHPTGGQQSKGQLSWPAEKPKTLVYLFAPWCSVCRISMPGLNLLPDEQLRVVAIALDWETPQQVEQFIAEVGYKGEVMLGDEQTRELFRVTGYPSYYVLDNKGEVLHQDRGLSTPPGLWLRTQL